MNGTNVTTPPLGLTAGWYQAGPADWAEVLVDFPLFSGIAKRRLRGLVRHATFAEYGPGDVVIQKNEPGDSLYVILGGSAKVRGKPAARRLRTATTSASWGSSTARPAPQRWWRRASCT